MLAAMVPLATAWETALKGLELSPQAKIPAKLVFGIYFFLFETMNFMPPKVLAMRLS